MDTLTRHSAEEIGHLSRDVAIPAPADTALASAIGRRLGLVVGIDAYNDSSIPNLKAAIADARAMHALMIDQACGAFDPEHTQLLIGEHATERAIRTAFSRLDKHALTDDEVWIYFAGHGLVERGKHMVLPFDADLSHVAASSVVLPDLIDRIRCQRKVVYLDCCHSGAVGTTRSVYSADEVLRGYSGRGTATFCSSEEDEKSHELPGEDRGAFSYWLERGLLGEADSDGDGVVSSGELWDFVRRKVEQDTRDRCGARQTPRFKFDGSGEFRLTRCPRPALEAAATDAAGGDRATLGESQPLGANHSLECLPEQLKDHLSTDEQRSLRALIGEGTDESSLARLRRAAAIAAECSHDALEDASAIIRRTLQARSASDAAESGQSRGKPKKVALILTRPGSRWRRVAVMLAEHWGVPKDVARDLVLAYPTPISDRILEEQASGLVADLHALNAQVKRVPRLKKEQRELLHRCTSVPLEIHATHSGELSEARAAKGNALSDAEAEHCARYGETAELRHQGALVCAKAGKAWAMTILAHQFESGTGTPRDLALAQCWLESAVRAGDLSARHLLADFIVRQPSAYHPETERLLAVRAGRRDVAACLRIGRFFADPSNPLRHLGKAAHYLRKAGAAEDLDAQAELARVIVELERKPAEATPVLTDVAVASSIAAQSEPSSQPGPIQKPERLIDGGKKTQRAPHDGTLHHLLDVGALDFVLAFLIWPLLYGLLALEVAQVDPALWALVLAPVGGWLARILLPARR